MGSFLLPWIKFLLQIQKYYFLLVLSWVSCRWRQCLEMRLHGIHCHNHLCQLFHECWVGTGKDCIGLCQYFKFVTLCLHYLENIIQVIDCLVVLFWWGWWYAVYILFRRCVSPLSWGSEHSLLFVMISVEKILNPDHVLRLMVCHLHYWMSLLKVDVCSKRVIPLENIITSEMVCPPACVNYLPFYNWSIK